MSNRCDNTKAKSPEHRGAWRRVAKHGGAIILDLGGADPWGERRAVEITAGGWRLLEPGAVPVAFLRAPDALPLPEPIAGAARFDDLARFVNCAKSEIPAVWAWIVTALRPFESGGAYPILALTGQQGSGKSLSSRFLQSLVDPSSLSGVAPPRDERDIYASAGARHLLAYDNLSGLRDDLADALCRIATGGAFTARALFSDFEQASITALRPLMINGIPASIAARNDLAERCIALELARPAHRIAEQELIAQWKNARPAMLGLICDGLSAALRNLDRVTIEGEAPRMSDAAQWAVAAAPGLGIERVAMLKSWHASRTSSVGAAGASDDLARVVVAVFVEVMLAAWHASRTSSDRAAVAHDDLARAVVALVAERDKEGREPWRDDPSATKAAHGAPAPGPRVLPPWRHA
jgi:putative DNA primase/helicase